MNTKAFSLALLIAFASMFMVYSYMEDQKSSLIKKYGAMGSVVIAKKDIKELEIIDDSKITTTVVPANFRAPGHFKTMKELENTIATVPILKGEQITKPRVTYPGAKTGLARQVSIGKRAMALKITDNQAVSKLLRPGDRVDILSTIDYAGGRRDKQKVKTILQDILILSTGLSMTNSIPMIGLKTDKEIKTMKLNTYTKYNTVTLELTPFEIQKLIYLLKYGSSEPILVLRNNNDKKIVPIGATKIFDLLGSDSNEAKSFFADKYSKK